MFQNILGPADSQNNTNNNPFNTGWYLVYQVVLSLYAISQIFTAIQNLITLGGLTTVFFVFLLLVIQPLILAASVVLQILAMRNRDFKKAQLALGGFAIYVVLYVALTLYIAVLANLDAGYTARFILQSILSLAVFCLCIGFGALRVYKILKPREPIRAIANDDAYRVIRGV